MRTRTTTWFETKIQYEKTMEDGLQKKVKEQYVVDALSFTEAEKRITEEMSSYISGAFDVADITKDLPFEENTFDIAFGVETICYSETKEKVAEQMARR